MSLYDKNVDVGHSSDSQNIASASGSVTSVAGTRFSELLQKLKKDSELRHVAFTFLTTLFIFAIYLLQGILLARILGPLGRGEFGTSIYFPRDILLYAGLLGGVEIINSYASRQITDSLQLKYSAARLAIVSGTITAIVAASISTVTLLIIGKAYLLPFCLVCCAFLPWEHLHLVISAVDRGDKAYGRYNFNRLIFALAFPLLLIVGFGLRVHELVGISALWLTCGAFVVSKIVGLLPTLRGMDLMTIVRGPKLTGAVKEKIPTVKQLLGEGKFFALSMIAKELFEKLDVFLIVALCSVEVSGYYFVAIPAAALLIVAPNALGVFTFNAGADKQRTISVQQAITVMSATIGFQVVATAIMMLLIPYLITWVYGSNYSPAIPFAMWLLPASAIRGYLHAADGYLKGRGKPMIGVWARVLSIFAMLGFVYLVYSTYAEISFPMAACFGQAISMMIISAFVIKDVVGLERNNAI